MFFNDEHDAGGTGYFRIWMSGVVCADFDPDPDSDSESDVDVVFGCFHASRGAGTTIDWLRLAK